MTNKTQTTNPVKTTKSRRWFRFRLRTLLVMVTVLSVPLGWIGWELDQRRREKVVVEWIKEIGGYVYFPTYLPTYERNWWEKTKDKWLGENVLVVCLDGTQVSDLSPLAVLKNLEELDLNSTQVSDLSPLTDLKNLEHLGLYSAQVRDLSPLAELRNLEWLDLWATSVSDLSPLSELKKLKSLYLQGTQVSDEQVQELRQALPYCTIDFWSND